MKFNLSSPTAVDEALHLLHKSSGSARLLAGGTDVMVGMRVGKIKPDFLINLNKIPDLAGIHPSSHFKGGLFIGALTKISDVEHSPELCGGYRILAQAAGTLASVQIRNLATLGGNICNAAPSADTATSLLVLDAVAEIAGQEGFSFVPLQDFFTGPGTTVLGSDKILIGFHLPPQPEKTAGTYIKHGARKAMDCCTLGVAAQISMADGRITKARIAIGAVAPTPLRVHEAEAVLEGKNGLTDILINKAAQIAEEAARPIDDVRGQAWYRKQMVGVDTQRALSMIAGMLEGEQV
ncbi:MAG: FAD binding domain-containing protein [Anaerolineales bacterium]|nr:FAD binding domain-containing protein [Anaerolineales bacterium]